MQRMIATLFLVAGVAMVAGVGWGLLAAGALLWFRDDRAEAWVRDRVARVRAWYGRTVERLRAAPRRMVSGVTMGAGLVTAPVGVAAIAGVGAGVLAAGAALVGFSLLLGWGA